MGRIGCDARGKPPGIFASFTFLLLGGTSPATCFGWKYVGIKPIIPFIEVIVLSDMGLEYPVFNK